MKCYDDLLQPQMSDAYIMVLEEAQKGGDTKTHINTIKKATGIDMACSSDFGDLDECASVIEDAGGLYLEEFDIAVIKPERDQVNTLSSLKGKNGVLSMEPDVTMYATGDMPSKEYLRGYQDGIGAGAETALVPIMRSYGQTRQAVSANQNQGYIDNADRTWGIEAVGATQSNFTGKGIKVAILDTGFDLNHPDFKGRKITAKSFISGEEVQDLNGHGTHCVGSSCGPLRGTNHPRYGVAYEADIYVGKVLSNAGSGSSAGIIDGIRWAVNNKCDVISMSLGSKTRVGDSYFRYYERIAQRALKSGTIVIAAAGNDSYRPNIITPVGSPANCPSIMAVAAVDHNLDIAYFSCGGVDSQTGREIDIAGPGVDVFSSWPMNQRYNSIPGTSMATPHVAGIAALYCEQNSNLRGQSLWQQLERQAREITLPMRDVGAGLVQAP